MIVNLFLNQTFVTFLLCVRKTWTAQLIVAISLWNSQQNQIGADTVPNIEHQDYRQ